MATYNLTKQVTNPASSSTQNVSSGDTINFTITLPSSYADNTPEVYANPTNCTLNQTGDTSAPFTFTATNFTSSSYSVQFSFVDTDSNTTSYSHTVSGNVTASLTAPTIGSVTTTNTASPNVTATVNLSSSGSGGTLEYAQTTTNSIPSTGWQTSNQFTHPRPTAAAGTAVTRYYWASRNRNTSASSSSVSKAVGYFTGDPSATISSISPSSPLAHDYTGSVDVVITGGSAGTRYRVLNTTTNAGMGNTGDGNGTVTITNTGTRLPTAGNTSNYKLQYKVLESNGGNDIFSDVSPSATFSISRNSPGVVATPTGFTVTDATTSGQTHPNGTGTTNNLSADALSGHTLQFRVDSGSWSTTSSYSHTYGTQRVYEARYVRTSDSAVSATAASITRRVADASITISPVTSILSTNSTNELKIADIGNATTPTQYRARATGNINGSSVTNLFINAPVAAGANPDINAANPGELPAAGTSATYKIMARVRTSDNGDGLYRQLPSSVSNSTWTLSRTDGTPNAYTIPDVTNAATGAEQNEFVQITGITETVTASRTSGTATFAVSSSTTTPSAGSFSSTAKNITNNQYLHVKQTSSGTAGTALNSGFSVGGVTDTFSVTTAAGGDITVSIVYDNESGSFLPDPGFSPFVSGQNGLSNAQAREITAGTDVVFQNISDPGSPGVIVSGLNKFTNNGSFTLNQGASVTRTWASGQTGNSVDTLTLTGTSATDLIYFKQPAVPPDTSVSPVTPTNRSFNDTATFNVTVNNVTSGETYKITENNFTTSLGSATASSTSVTIPMTIGNGQANNYGQLGVGQTKTYEIYASRPANLGGTGSFVATNDTFTVTRNVEPVTVPDDIVFTDPGTNDDNVNITVEASGGSGGILQVSDDNTNWDANGTAYAAIRNTQGTYYARRLGSQSASVSTTRTENYTPPFRGADSNITVTGTAVNATITPGATANLTATINNGGTLDEYRILTTDTNTPLASGTSVGSRTSSGSITISSGEQPDGQGTSAGYKVQVRRPTASGGNNTFADTGDTFTITRQAISAPTDLVFGADPGTNSATVSITVTAYYGANGTIQLSETSNFSSTQGNGTSFTFTRGTAKTIYARRVDGSVVSSTYSESNTVGYKTPDLSVAGTNSTITFNAGSATTTVSNVARGTETVAVRVNNGSTNLATRTGNGTLTFSSSLPSVGNTTTYELFTKRAVSTGGDGSTFYATNDTFTVTRSVEPVSAPTDISFGADPGTASATVSITCTASGGSGGTLQVSQDNVNWSSNGTSFTFTRGTAKTIYARRVDGSVVSSTYSESNTVGYKTPDLSVAGTNSTITFNAGSATTTVSNVARGTETVAVRVNNGSTNLATRTGNGTLTFSSSLPSVGNTTTYELFTKRAVSTGGDGSTFYATNDTFTVTRSVEPVSAPTDISFGADPGTASATVSITCTASGGSGGTLQVSQDNVNWSSNGTSFTFTRGTAKTIYARRTGQGSTSSSYSEAHTVGYIAVDGKVDLSPTSVTLAYDANSDITITLTNGTPGNQYQLRLGNANLSTLLLAGSDTSGTLTIGTAVHPTVNNTSTFTLYGRRTTASGGNNTYALTGDSVVVTRNSESLSAPEDITFGADPGTFSQTVSISATASLGSGGTLKVSDDGNNWDTNGTSYTFTRGTAKTIYARREGVGANSANYSEEHTVNKLATDTSITVSPTSATVAPNANTTVTINISNATQQHTYHVYKQTGTNTYQGINVNTGTLSGSTGSVTIPNSQLPTAGNSTTYRFYGILPISSGGLGVQQITNGTFTISRTAEDVTPNAFTFTDVSNVSRSTTQTSNTITVAGLSTGTSVVVSIIGGTYSKNSGSYTSSTGTASNGDTFSVRHTSSSGFLTNTDTQLTIGGISDTFRSTTLAQDTTPNNYTFNNATDAGVSTLVLSNVQTITGITGNVSVSVSGQGTPKISINGGTFISSGTIQNNQTLQVRLTSSASNSTSHTATVTLGTGTYAQETFVVTTVAASGGTGGGVGAGSSDYGIEVYDTDGTTKVLSPATRYAVRVTDVTTFTFTGTGTANDSVLLTTDMTDLTTSNSDVLFLPGSLVLEVTRESNGFRITNLSSASFTRTMFGIRF